MDIDRLNFTKIAVVFLIMMASAVTLGGTYLVYLDWNATDLWEERAQRGDYWGGHVAAGAGLVANLLLVITLLMQRKELEYQRLELQATRQEMVESRKVAEQQSQTMDMQLHLASDTAEINQIISLGERMHSILAAATIYDKTINLGNGNYQSEQRWGNPRSAKQYLGAFRLLSDKVDGLDFDSASRENLKEFLGLIEDQYYSAAVRTVEAVSE